MPHYKVVEPEYLERYIADLAVDLAVADLRITKPSVRFVQGTIPQLKDWSTDTQIGGLAWPSGKEIFLRCNLNHRELVSAAFHECRHASQFQRGLIFNRRRFEMDAEIYCEEMLSRLGDPMPANVLQSLLRAAMKRESLPCN